MNSQKLSIRKLAVILGVNQPFLSQIRSGKRPLPKAFTTKFVALGAYNLLTGDKWIEVAPGGPAAPQTTVVGTKKLERAMGFEPTTSCLGSKHSTPELRPLVATAQA